MVDTQSAPASIPLETIIAGMNLDLTLGILIICGLLAMMLYGITSAQTLFYFTKTPRDGRVIRAAIFILWIFDTVESALVSHVVYNYCINALKNPILWNQLSWSGATHFMLLTLGDTIVTIIFAYRIWKLDRKIWAMIAILPPALLVFIGGQVLGVFVLVNQDYETLRHRFSWLYCAIFALQAFSDIAIMVSLCIALLQRRSKIRKSRSIIGTLIFFSVNTCLLTSAVGLASLFTYALSPNILLWQAFDTVFPKVMLNSLLALLNSRDAIRNRTGSDGLVSIHLSRLDPVESTTARSTTTINIMREKSVKVDPPPEDSVHDAEAGLKKDNLVIDA